MLKRWRTQSAGGRESGRVLFKDWRSGESASDSPAIRLLTDFLKLFGEFAFDIEHASAAETRKICLDWAAGIESLVRENSQDQPDWKAMHQGLRKHRRLENKFVNSSVSGLREVLWGFIEGVKTSFSFDRKSDATVESDLRRLSQAVESDSVEDLRREALRAVSSINNALAERQKRQRQQMAQLGRHLKKLRQELVEAREEMATDALTQLYNRKAFDSHLNRVADLSLFSGQSCGLILIDIDHFKRVNDNHGHQAGDVVLKEVADLCVRNFPRRADFVARFGGEEFAIVIQEHRAAVEKLAKRLAAVVRQHTFTFQEQTIPLTVSAGVAELQEGESVEEWFARADKALYAAKEQGRDRVLVS